MTQPSSEQNRSEQPTEYRQKRYERPQGATDLLLIRHGESRAATADNPFPLVDGHGDPELHSQGRDQAQRVGVRLKNQPIDAIYVTKLRRTVETAAPLCQHLGVTPLLDPDLHEVHLGEWEGGVMRIKAHENHPVYQRVLLEQRWDVIPGAESHNAFRARLLRALERIRATHPNELVAAFVHGGVIGAILAHATGAQNFAFNGADNGSISHVVLLEDGNILLRRFNDATHLRAELASATAQMT